MFSPEASVLGARSSLRNPRRRQRKDSDGVQLPRRKRNKLGDDTLHLNGDALTNGNGSAIAKSHVNLDDADGSMVLVDMPVREKKAVSKRVLKDDVGQYLVSTRILH
jgi:nuclear pore complex protein Nup133